MNRTVLISVPAMRTANEIDFWRVFLVMRGTGVSWVGAEGGLGIYFNKSSSNGIRLAWTPLADCENGRTSRWRGVERRILESRLCS